MQIKKSFSDCRSSKAAVQALGSGGPMHGGGRGSSAYLLWYLGKPAVIVDMGGDTPTALARAGALPGTSRVLLISHLHPDHVSGLPDFFWGEMTAHRSAPLTVAGPTGGEKFHDIHTLFQRLFSESGAFPDLQSLLSGKEFPIDIRIASGDGETVYDEKELKVRALKVPHGRAPALAYRIDGPNFSVVFAGDQTARDPDFACFARSADLLVVHAIVNRTVEGSPLANVLSLPRELGRMAADSEVKRVVLSHFMEAPPGTSDAEFWSLADLPSVIEDIRKEFGGSIEVAADLSCFELVQPPP